MVSLNDGLYSFPTFLLVMLFITVTETKPGQLTTNSGYSQGLVAYAFNPSTGEAEASLCEVKTSLV